MPQESASRTGSPSGSRGSSSSSISRSAAVNTDTKAGTSFVSVRAGDCMRFTSCRKAVMPPNVSVPACMRTAAQRNANR